jgi:hypothetical protein
MATIRFMKQPEFDHIMNYLLVTEGIPDDLKQIAKKMENRSTILRTKYDQKAKAHYQRLMDEIRQKDALDASIHQLNILNKQKVAIYYSFCTVPPPPPMATPVAEPIQPPPQPVIYDSGDSSDSDSDSDGEGLDGMEDDGDDSDDEPIANLMHREDPGEHDYSICSARCASGTREEVGRCKNPSTSMESNHLHCQVGVCGLHKRAIDTAMEKYFGWDRSMGHLYGWWNSPESIRDRNTRATIKAGYQGARRQPKRRKTIRFRGQLRGHGNVYNGVRMGTA